MRLLWLLSVSIPLLVATAQQPQVTQHHAKHRQASQADLDKEVDGILKELGLSIDDENHPDKRGQPQDSGLKKKWPKWLQQMQRPDSSAPDDDNSHYSSNSHHSQNLPHHRQQPQQTQQKQEHPKQHPQSGGVDYQQYVDKYAGGAGSGGSSKGGQGGQGGFDYHQYVNKYAGGAGSGDSSKGGQGGQGGFDYQQYVDKYAGGAGSGDSSKGGQGGQGGFDYQQYVDKYAGGAGSGDSSKGGQGGQGGFDYQQFIDKYAGGAGSGDSSKGGQGGQGGFDYQQYVDKYAGGAGSGDSSKGGQGGQGGFDYQQYMDKYAGGAQGASAPPELQGKSQDEIDKYFQEKYAKFNDPEYWKAQGQQWKEKYAPQAPPQHQGKSGQFQASQAAERSKTAYVQADFDRWTNFFQSANQPLPATHNLANFHEWQVAAETAGAPFDTHMPSWQGAQSYSRWLEERRSTSAQAPGAFQPESAAAIAPLAQPRVSVASSMFATAFYFLFLLTCLIGMYVSYYVGRTLRKRRDYEQLDELLMT